MYGVAFEILIFEAGEKWFSKNLLRFQKPIGYWNSIQNFSKGQGALEAIAVCEVIWKRIKELGGLKWSQVEAIYPLVDFFLIQDGFDKCIHVKHVEFDVYYSYVVANLRQKVDEKNQLNPF